MNAAGYLVTFALAFAGIIVAGCSLPAPWAGPLGIAALGTLIAALMAGDRDRL